jgi:hypothetical protein
MNRRSLITLLGGAAAWTLTARGQQAAMPVVGLLHPGSPEANAKYVASFRQGLGAGYVEGRNLAIEYRWGHGDSGRLPKLAADLVRQQVAVMVTPGSIAATLAAKAATDAIPIVYASGADPVQAGLVAGLKRHWRQHHRFWRHEFGTCSKAAWTLASIVAPRCTLGGLAQSRQSGEWARVHRYAGGGRGHWSGARNPER